MRESRRRAIPFEPRFHTAPADQRLAADLFIADLFGVRQPPHAYAQPSRPAPPPPPATWSRPDLIFDHYAHRAPLESEDLLREVADEGWSVVASPGSDTPASALRPRDVVVQRALGDGRLAFVRVLGDDIQVRDLYGPGSRLRPDILVLRQPAEEPEPGEDVTPGPSPDSGEVTVHLPLLTAHGARGFKYDLSGPNCVLRWARVPREFGGKLDVVVHFHGYKGHNAMRLQHKANASGLDLQSPGVSRPTLGLVPHGHAFASRTPNMDGFDFPAISTRDELQRFLEAALTAFKSWIGSADRTVTIDRVILTGHSGGGAALNRLMRSIGTSDGVHGFHYFDATYGGGAAIAADNGWLATAMRRDAEALRSVSDEAGRARLMRERGGSLRIIFIEGSGTAATAHTIDQFVVTKLRELVPDESLRNFLRRYYRAQRVVTPASVNHGRVPAVCGPRLLADPGHDLAPDAKDLAAPRPAVARPAATEDAPPATTADGTAVERVRTTIDSTLQAFRNILVTVPAPTGRDVAVQTPYFINKPTSPSRLRGEQRRPALLRNDVLSRLYGALPPRAKVGKAYPADVKTFLQGAIDANAVPGQASGVTAVTLKSFLSDVGVGVDCSGFVSQALNACMEALGRSERIDTSNTSSAYLRGGTGHNTRQFDVISRPRDLSPGDTMWKTGHIRIIQRVEPQADGSIHFITAESSSVELVGGVAKTWKCPQPDKFVSLKVERSGTFRASTEVNVFSRYKPLADVLHGGRSARAPEDSPSTPTPAPTASRPVPPPPPPSSTAPRPAPPSPAPAPAPAPTAARTLTQAEIDRLAAIEFAKAADINTFFSRKGADGFVTWFNTTLGGQAPFRRTNGGAIRMASTTEIKERFNNFWNSIPVAYDRPRINALDFAALMCIVLNETGGDFWAHPERCGGGRTDARGPHPGLAYAFDKIIGVKASYNTLASNKRAGELFNDADFNRAHGTLGAAARLANHGSDFGNAWNSEYYPQNEFSTREDLTENGFIMQADFYKFRGRGVIQTTSRGAYLAVVTYIQGYSGSNGVLTEFKTRWTGLSRDVAATVSTNADWDKIFSQGEVLARAVRLHSGTGDSDYRTMSTQAATLLHVPPKPERGVPRGTKGSIFFMGRRIAGRYSYASGAYRDRVLAMLGSMLAL